LLEEIEINSLTKKKLLLNDMIKRLYHNIGERFKREVKET